MGGDGDRRGDEPEQTGQAGQTLPQDCQAVQGKPKLQLHVRHHFRIANSLKYAKSPPEMLIIYHKLKLCVKKSNDQ